MTEIHENTKIIFKDIIKLLLKAVKNRKNPYHTPVFSSIAKNNITESRVVVLRKFEDKNLILNFHTDFRSPKITNLKKNFNTSFLFYDQKIKIQLRIKTQSTINNQNSISKEAWDLTKLSSRKCYLTKKNPSSYTTIPEDGISSHLIGIDPTKDETEIGYKNFTVVENKILNIDWLYLKSSGHRRLNISFNNNKPHFDWVIP